MLIHLLTFGLGELGYRLGWWEDGPLAWLAKLAGAPASVWSREARLEELRRLREERERVLPLVFVDVDPTQATPEAPPDTPYYGAFNSRAQNPDTSRQRPQPELDGSQTQVLKTADTERASPPEFPLQPSPPPPEPAPPAEPPPDLVQTAPEETTPPEPEPETLPEPEPPPEPGDLAMLASAPRASAQLPHPSQPEPAPERPRTLAEAMARRGLNPDSALIGRKYRQEGGVKRFALESSLDVQGSPLGDYDRRFVAAVQESWYALLREQRYSLDRVGRVVLKFRLTRDGRITHLQVEESDVGDVYTTICQLAVTRPAPYDPWPADMARLIGNDYREIRFTFYY
ncbi:MAG: hypothetical protein D6766_13280 [Verrucomicrobia bacterium]|nr:MAG: hypothetical protein D6766_13280 [Verrucomicrobiota bacterium]